MLLPVVTLWLSSITSVAVQGRPAELVGPVVLRLVDAGLTVEPVGANAHCRISFRVDSTTGRVKATGTQTIQQTFDAEGPAAGLELGHRAVWLARAAGGAASPPRGPVVRLTVDPSIAGDVRARMAQAVLGRGYGLAPTAKLSVCAQRTANGYRITVGPNCREGGGIEKTDIDGLDTAVAALLPGPRPRARTPTAPTPRTEAPDATRATETGTASDLASSPSIDSEPEPQSAPLTDQSTPERIDASTRQQASPRTESAPNESQRFDPETLGPPPPPVPPTREQPPSASIEPRMPPSDPVKVRFTADIRAGGLFLTRESAGDLGGTFGVEASGRRWGGRIDLAWLSTSDGPLSANEWLVSAGPTAGWSLQDRLRLSIALRAGLNLHVYRLSTTTGTRLDAVIDLPITLTWRFTPRWGLEGQLVPGLTGQARRHVLDDREIWRRGALRLAAGLGLVWRMTQ